MEKRAAYQRAYNEKRREKYWAKKQRREDDLPDVLPCGRYPFYWETTHDQSPIANPALD